MKSYRDCCSVLTQTWSSSLMLMQLRIIQQSNCDHALMLMHPSMVHQSSLSSCRIRYTFFSLWLSNTKLTKVYNMVEKYRLACSFILQPPVDTVSRLQPLQKKSNNLVQGLDFLYDPKNNNFYDLWCEAELSEDLRIGKAKVRNYSIITTFIVINS